MREENKTPAGGPGRGENPQTIDASSLSRVGAKASAYAVEAEVLAAFKTNGHAPSHAWRYLDVEGYPVGAVARFEAGTLDTGKTYRQFRWEGGRYFAGLKDGKLPLYRLSELQTQSAAPVLWCEGEKCCEAVAARGFTTTTTAGGAGGFAAWLKARPDGLQDLKGRTVIVLADNDTPGHNYAGRVAAALQSAGADVRTVDPLPWADLGEGADVADWLSKGHDAYDLRKLAETAPVYEPLEQGPRQGTVPELNKAALHGLAGEFVALCRPYTEAHDVGLLLGFLTATGCMMGADPQAPCFFVGAERHHARLFANLVGVTAKGRKGTAWAPVKLMLDCVAELDAKEPNAHALDTSSLEADSRAVVNKPGTIGIHSGGLASGEGIIWRIRDACEIKKSGRKKPDAPPEIDTGEPDKRLLVYQAEFGAILRLKQRDGNTLGDYLRTAWDGHDLAPLIKHNFVRATRPHLCIVANVTVEELRACLSHADYFNGFANRFLWALVSRARLLPDPAPLPREPLERLAKRIRDAVLAARGRVFRFTPQAAREWEAVYRELENRPAHGTSGRAQERAAPYVRRIALIFACLDKSDSIGCEHLAAAIAVVNYCVESACLIFGSAPTLTRPQSAVVRCLQRNGGRGTARDIQRASIAGIANVEQALAELEALERLGIVRRESTTKPSGREVELFCLTPDTTREAA